MEICGKMLAHKQIIIHIQNINLLQIVYLFQTPNVLIKNVQRNIISVDSKILNCINKLYKWLQIVVKQQCSSHNAY